MDKHYWESYYQTQGQINPIQSQHSLFAECVLSYISRLRDQKGCLLLELGCGNGRDSLFFAQNHLKVRAIDQAEGQIASLNQHAMNYPYTYKPLFVAGDFTRLESLELEEPESGVKGYDCVYSRFTLHSVSKIEQDKVLQDSLAYCAENGLLAIEVRGERNALFGKGEAVVRDGEIEHNAFIHDDHYRRFLNFSQTCDEIESLRYVETSLVKNLGDSGLESASSSPARTEQIRKASAGNMSVGGGGYMISLLVPLLYLARILGLVRILCPTQILTLIWILAPTQILRAVLKYYLVSKYFTRARIEGLRLLMARMITLSASLLKRCERRVCSFASRLVLGFSHSLNVFRGSLRYAYPRGLVL